MMFTKNKSFSLLLASTLESFGFLQKDPRSFLANAYINFLQRTNNTSFYKLLQAYFAKYIYSIPIADTYICCQVT